jgi:hypothetical protein
MRHSCDLRTNSIAAATDSAERNWKVPSGELSDLGKIPHYPSHLSLNEKVAAANHSIRLNKAGSFA